MYLAMSDDGLIGDIQRAVVREGTIDSFDCALTLARELDDRSGDYLRNPLSSRSKVGKN
jgi:hypothetical protein